MSDWNADDGLGPRGPLDVTRAATLVLDGRGAIVGWSRTAQDLFGYAPHEVIGHDVQLLLAHPPGPGSRLLDGLPERHVRRDLEVRHRDGRVLPVATGVLSLGGGRTEPAWILAAAPLEELQDWEIRQAMLRGLATQSPINLAIYDTRLRLTWVNAASMPELPGPLAGHVGTLANDLYPGEILSPGHPPTLQDVMERVMATGEPVVDLHFRGRPPADPGRDYVWSCSYYRLQDGQGRTLGVCEDAYDITERYRTEQRLALLVRAGARIGASLDVPRTARDVADACVPQFADAVQVDVGRNVLDGEDPVPGSPTRQRWVCVARRAGGAQPAACVSGQPKPGPDGRVEYPPDSPQGRSLASGRTVLDSPASGDTPGGGVHSRLVVPLRSRSTTMGLVTFARRGTSEPFDGDDVDLVDELVARTAAWMDNVWHYTRERNAALTLQRRLLPQRLPVQTALEVAHRYLPADNVAGVGGDWYDVIPLSGARVALVVGDVVGHGLRAAATMGRLRATVRALARLDFPPDELLARLDDQVEQAAQEVADARTADREPGTDKDYEDEDLGVTCVFAVYDPISGRFSVARAGHLPPAIVHPDAELVLPDVPAGPPLGVGGLPFESVDLQLPEGSLVALFTDGLVEPRNGDMDHGLGRLREALGDLGRPLEELCDRALATLLPGAQAADDAALLLARTRLLGDQQVVVWDLPPTAAAVGDARSAAARQLGSWGLPEMSFTTELVVSELVTNAIRHASGPVQLRIVRDRNLLVEVSDTRHTSPHLRHAAGDDEGGRGLFIVAQMVQKWGTRYTATGKTIWTEQSYAAGPAVVP